MPDTQMGSGNDNAAQNVPGFPGAILYTTTGGGLSKVVAAAASATINAQKTGEGRIARLVINTTATTAISLYDALTVTGNPVFTTSATVAQGTVFDLQIPFSVGLTIAAGAGTPAYCLTYW